MTTFDKCKRDLLVNLLKTSHKATYLRENGYDLESYDYLEEIVADYLLESGFIDVKPVRKGEVFYEISHCEAYDTKSPRKPYYLTEQTASCIEGEMIRTQMVKEYALTVLELLYLLTRIKLLKP